MSTNVIASDHRNANPNADLNMGLTMGEAQMIAQDRHRWRRDIVALCPTLG